MKKIAHLLMGRLTIVGVSILLQICWLFLVLWKFSYQFTYANLIIRAAAIVLVLVIANKWENPANKLSWTFLILLSPILGIMLYFLFGRSGLTKHTREQMDAVNREVDACMPVDEEAVRLLQEADPSVLRQSKYIADWGHFPVYRNTATKYYESGEAMFPDMLAALESAKHFIFLEYFIIEPGEMWQSIVDILAQKVREGLDVRVMYDDLGSISTFNFSNALALEKLGIRCVTFNPLLALKGTANYRDHRKMLIVDDAVAYSGGVNLADRYINREHPYGHWKDTGFRLTGAPVRSFTHMFLTFWNAFSLQKEEPMPMPPAAAAAEPAAQDGWGLSYYDSPLNSEATSNRLYIDLLSQATDYAWFFTPYLMLGDDLLDAMLAAAQRGVDVRIIMPGIPDKKLIFRMSRSFYQVLLTGGVKIYEYTPGFVHAKSLVCDDRAATVGTVNLDYRSLFLHFENNSLFYRGSIVARVKEDFLATQSQCRAVEACDMKRYSRRWIVDGVLRIFAPLC